MQSCEEFLKGKKLAERLEALKEAANDNHAKATTALRTSLEHARCAGEALEEAYKRLGRKGRWMRWLRQNFNGSGRTSRAYRRVFREWDTVKEAIERGVDVKSIQAALRLLAGKSGKVKRPSTQHKIDHFARAAFFSFLRLAVDNLPEDKSQVLFDNFRNEFWPKIEFQLSSPDLAALSQRLVDRIQALKPEEHDVLVGQFSTRIWPTWECHLNNTLAEFMEEHYYEPASYDFRKGSTERFARACEDPEFAKEYDTREWT